MRIIALSVLLAASAFGQALHTIIIIPDASGNTGEIDWRNSSGTAAVRQFNNGSGIVQFQAPDTVPTLIQPVSYGTLPSNLIMRAARGTSASPTATQSGDELGRLTGSGYSGSAFVNPAYIGYEATDNYTGSLQGADIKMLATPAGSTTRAEKWRLHGNGIVTMTNELDFPASTGRKILYFNSGAGTVYSTEIQAGTLRNTVDFNTSVFDWGFYTSSGTVWNSLMQVDQTNGIQTISGIGGMSGNPLIINTHMIPNGGGTLDVGGVALGLGRFRTGYFNTIDVSSGTKAPSGSVGTSVTCTGGNVASNQVVSGGLVTSVTCAAPSGGGDMILAATQTVTGVKTWSGIPIKWNNATGQKLQFYDSGTGHGEALYETNIQSGARREAIDFSSSKFDWGYSTWSSPTLTWHSLMTLTEASSSALLTLKTAVSGNTIGITADGMIPNTGQYNMAGDFYPQLDNTYNLGLPLGFPNVSWKGLYVYSIYLLTGITAPSGSAGLTSTLSCPATQAIKTLTVSGGVVTAATCGVP